MLLGGLAAVAAGLGCGVPDRRAWALGRGGVGADARVGPADSRHGGRTRCSRCGARSGSAPYRSSARDSRPPCRRPTGGTRASWARSSSSHSAAVVTSREATQSDLQRVRGADVYLVFVESYGAVSYDRRDVAGSHRAVPRAVRRGRAGVGPPGRVGLRGLADLRRFVVAGARDVDDRRGSARRGHERAADVAAARHAGDDVRAAGLPHRGADAGPDQAAGPRAPSIASTTSTTPRRWPTPGRGSAGGPCPISSRWPAWTCWSGSSDPRRQRGRQRHALRVLPDDEHARAVWPHGAVSAGLGARGLGRALRRAGGEGGAGARRRTTRTWGPATRTPCPTPTRRSAGTCASTPIAIW